MKAETAAILTPGRITRVRPFDAFETIQFEILCKHNGQRFGAIRELPAFMFREDEREVNRLIVAKVIAELHEMLNRAIESMNAADAAENAARGNL